MFPMPRADLTPNSADFERLPQVKPTGFREYDARWLFPEEINLMGLQAIGLGLATLFERRGVPKRIVVGHDFHLFAIFTPAPISMAKRSKCWSTPAPHRSF